MQVLDPVEQDAASADDSRAMAARALDAARAASGAFELFGSFMLGAHEYALPASTIREVVNYPERIIPVPLAPAFLEGVFTLRGCVIPVLDLARIFDPAAQASASTPGSIHNRAARKVIIIDHDDILVGITFDTIGEVLRVQPGQRSVLQRDGKPHGVVAGTIVKDDGARLLQILDAHALVQIENVPQVRALQASTRSDRHHFHQQAGRRKCVSFSVAGVRFAFDMAAIREIIAVPESRPSIMASKLCVGRINFRGHPVALIDFAALMQFNAAPAADQAGQRILIAPIGERLVGFLVDSVDTIFNYFEHELLPIPLLSRTRAAMFAGCVSRESEGDILCLNHEGVLSSAELVEISAGHVNLYQQEAQNEAGVTARTSTARRAPYVVFSLGSAMAVEMRLLREIIAAGAALVCPPGMPSWVAGILNLRQQVITVLDVRAFFGMPPLAAREAARILVVEHGAERYGLLVDSVDTIAHVVPGQRRTSPRLMGDGKIAEVIDLPGSDDVLHVFDLAGFLARVDASR